MEIEITNSSQLHQRDIESGSFDHHHGVGACLAWEDLTAVLPNFGNGHTRRLINGLTGYARPGRILSVMGPSGSGKSTFLDCLTGRVAGNVVMSGNVLLNGKKRSRLHYGVVAYVTQEDILLGTLTVRETISYSARLRLPSFTTEDEIKETVENVITQMGLQECADTLIGNWHLRGISGGEKKRLSIALEIITQPYLLFLDEPTSGLDSASAFFVCQALKNVACSGRTIISSIHQPSSEVFALFDDLLLLSCGETIYFGEAKMAIQFFADSGFPCPSKRNPADHFLRCVNSDFDDVNTTLMGSQRMKARIDISSKVTELSTSEIRARLLHRYQTSEFSARMRSKIRESSYDRLVFHETSGSEATWLRQLVTLTKRSSKNMSRDFGYYWLRIIVFIVVSLCVGSVFRNVGSETDSHALMARGACGGFISGFMTFMTIGGFPSFIEEMKIFTKERLNGHYGVGVFIISNFVSAFPFLVAMSVSSASITYFMVRYHPGFEHYVFAVVDLLISIGVVESCMMVIAAIVPNFLMGVILGAGYIGIMMLTAGYFRTFPDLPKPFWTYPISYINYMAWALQGAYKNDIIGMQFQPLGIGTPKLDGEQVLTSVIGITLQHSKWWDLAVVALILVCYRMGFFCILKLKERALPVLKAYYSTTTLRYLKKRPSFRMKAAERVALAQPFSSKRHHHIVYSLSSQEGLNSPLH